jgi:ATP synthase proteolipid subunit
MADSELAPKFAPFIGMAGIAAAMTFGCIGAAYGTAKSGIGIAGVATFRPDLIMKCLIPVVMSGIIAVYSLVVSVLIAEDLSPPTTQRYSLFAYVARRPFRTHPKLTWDQWLPASRLRSCRWPDWSRCRILHWHCG